MPYGDNEVRIQYMRDWRKRNSDYMKNYRKSHRDRDRETGRLWRLKNKDKVRQQNIERRLNPEKHKLDLETKRKWRLRNPGKYRLYSKKRAELVDAVGDINNAIVQRVYEHNILKFKTLTCELCIRPVKFGEDSLEHKVALARGGDNSFENLAVAHFECNRSKNSKTLDEWFRLNPHLESLRKKWLNEGVVNGQ